MAYGTAGAALALDVDIALHECTIELYTEDAIHGIYTHISNAYQQGGMSILSVELVRGSQFGGASDRHRMVLHAEKNSFSALLPALEPLAPDSPPTHAYATASLQ